MVCYGNTCKHAEISRGSCFFFNRNIFLTSACWTRTWRRTSTPPSPPSSIQKSFWLCPTRGSSGGATGWAATTPPPTSCPGGCRDDSCTAANNCRAQRFPDVVTSATAGQNKHLSSEHDFYCWNGGFIVKLWTDLIIFIIDFYSVFIY